MFFSSFRENRHQNYPFIHYRTRKICPIACISARVDNNPNAFEINKKWLHPSDTEIYYGTFIEYTQKWIYLKWRFWCQGRGFECCAIRAHK